MGRPAWPPSLADEPALVLPASADGRDLRPRLAAALHRPLLRPTPRRSPPTRRRPGPRRSASCTASSRRTGSWRRCSPASAAWRTRRGARGRLSVAAVDTADAATASLDAEVLATLPADAATMDLAEAPRIVGGGAGPRRPGALRRSSPTLGGALGASVGATRVITDRGWVGHERQIGTTGVIVDPQLYLAFGISGAVQHTSGLGTPAHIISVNTDPHCPMMQLADLAIVSDANGRCRSTELARRGCAEPDEAPA